MMTFRPYHDPPLDNAATPAPAYHAGELLSTAHRHTLVEIYYEKKAPQLLQRRCAMLRVTEYLSRSHNVIRNHTPKQGICKSLLVFHCDYVSISYRF